MHNTCAYFNKCTCTIFLDGKAGSVVNQSDTCMWCMYWIDSTNKLFGWLLTLCGHIKTAEQQYSAWYTGRWWMDCYIWYSEEGTGRAATPRSPLLTVPNVHPSTASVPTSYYSMWHYHCLWFLKGLIIYSFLHCAIRLLLFEWLDIDTECMSYTRKLTNIQHNLRHRKHES